MADLSKYRKNIEYCAYCPKMCRFACPVAQAEGRETVHPTAKATLLHLLMKNSLEWSREVADTFYRCTGCLISRTFCEHEIEVFPSWVEARREAVRRGVAPDSVMEQDKTVERHKNPYGENLSRKLDGYTPTRLARNDAPVMFFAGCTTIQFYDKHISASIKLLEAAGADLGVYLDEYICCGYPSYSLGHWERFERLARNVAEKLGKTPTIVTVCPTCATTLKDIYPQAGMKFDGEILHISQYLHRSMKEGKIRFGKKAGRALYHDPCHLGRYMNVYDEPRELLEAACREVIEFPWTREEARCCGGGGGILLTARDTSKRIAEIRAQFAGEAKPDILVSACPTCDRSLERAWERKKVADLVRILANALEE